MKMFKNDEVTFVFIKMLNISHLSDLGFLDTWLAWKSRVFYELNLQAEGAPILPLIGSGWSQ